MEVVGQGRSEEEEEEEEKSKKEVMTHVVEEEKNTFKFNADAPEFVPSSYALSQTSTSTSTPSSLQGFCYYFDPWFNFTPDGTCVSGSNGATATDWICFTEDEPPRSSVADAVFSNSSYNGRVGGSCGGGGSSPRYSGNSSEAAQKIVKQVEYQFTDAHSHLASNDNNYMLKHTNKDPDGYVPITAIISQKRMKTLGCNNFVLTKALRTSPNLDVSEDGKKVRKKVVLTEREKEEFQLRTVVVENLPEECNRQKVEKIFSTVGSVRSVRICHPSEPATSSPRSSYKSDILVSNKLHALVEYENSDQAEKAAERLNDERNWRKGLRVRVMRRRSPRSVIRNRRGDRDQYFNNEMSDEEEEDNVDDDEERKQKQKQKQKQQQKQVTADNERTSKETLQNFKLSSQHIEGTSLGKMMRTKSLGRVKSRGGSQANNINGRHGLLTPSHSGPGDANYLVRSESSNKLLGPRRVGGGTEGIRGLLSSSPQSSVDGLGELARQSPWGPRMPDGTRGFAMGRGRPISPAVPTCSTAVRT